MVKVIPTQNAILPIDECRLTAGYKTAGYTTFMLRTYGMRNIVHYGVDMTDDNRAEKQLRAPFDMKIVAAGFDTLMGNTIIATSTKKINIHGGKMKGAQYITVRMAHLASITKGLEKGDIVKQGTIVGNYGHTGRYGGADHLHVELDLDQTSPTASPTLSGRSNIWKAGTDTTLAPMDVFKVGNGQKFFATYWEEGMDKDDTVTLNTKGKVVVATKKA